MAFIILRRRRGENGNRAYFPVNGLPTFTVEDDANSECTVMNHDTERPWEYVVAPVPD